MVLPRPLDLRTEPREEALRSRRNVALGLRTAFLAGTACPYCACSPPRRSKTPWTRTPGTSEELALGALAGGVEEVRVVVALRGCRVAELGESAERLLVPIAVRTHTQILRLQEPGD